MCLVRSPAKVYLPDNDGELRSLYRTRTLQEGEVLTLVGQFKFRKVVFLRCFDSEGGSVYLKLGAKGRFSVVAARPESVSGVHDLRSLLAKRLPLTVKLLSPAIPPELERLGLASPIALCLQAVYSEEVVFAQALSRQHSPFLALPLNAHLKLAPARNHSSIRGSSEFQRLCAGAEENLSTFLDRITPFNEHGIDPVQLQSQVEEEPPADPDSVFDYEEFGTTSSGHPSDPPPVSDHEIDQLYDYIRGLAPLPDFCHESRGSLAGGRPAPPPVDTIPSVTRHKTPSHHSSSHQHLTSSSKRSQSPAAALLGLASADGLRRVSKSTEKVSALEPIYHHPHPQPRLRSQPLRRHSDKKRPRPLSLAEPSHYFRQQGHLYAPGPAPLYRSLANLAMGDYVQGSGGAPPHQSHYPPHHPPHFAPVFPRFAPRYAFAPPSYRLT